MMSVAQIVVNLSIHNSEIECLIKTPFWTQSFYVAGFDYFIYDIF